MDHFIFLCLVGGMITLPGMCSETFLLQYCGEGWFFSFFFPGVSYSTELPIRMYGFLPEEVVIRRYFAFIFRRPFMPESGGSFCFIYIFFWSSGFILPSFLPLYLFPSFPPFLFLFNRFLLSIASFRVRISPPFSFIFIKWDERGMRRKQKWYSCNKMGNS